MSTVVKKTINVKIDGQEVSVTEGTVVLEAAKLNNCEVSNLCYNRKLKPCAACRTCMVEVNVDGKKDLVYSCTHPVEEGMEIIFYEERKQETDRFYVTIVCGVLNSP